MAQVAEARRKELAEAPAGKPSSSEETTALAHLYRAEVTKANVWRQRLDTTTNWAVVTTAAGISFTLGDKDVERHIVILLTSLLVTFFLFLEARRYRHYDVWQTRVHLIESHFYGPLLWPEGRQPSADWRRLLAKDLQSPAYHIPYREALGWRLRRNYVWIYAVLMLTWLAKLFLHPQPAASWRELVSHAAIGSVPGTWTMSAAILFHCSLIVIAIITWGMQTASGEVMTPKRTRDKIERADSRLSEAPATGE